MFGDEGRCKFMYGDRVVAGNNTGKIVSIKKEKDKYLCTVKFDDKTLIPPELDFDQRALKKLQQQSVGNCPVCYTEWTVTTFNMYTWRDCKKCGKTKEKIEEEKREESTQWPSPSYRGVF